jgi:hypothetical protein
MAKTQYIAVSPWKTVYLGAPQKAIERLKLYEASAERQKQTVSEWMRRTLDAAAGYKEE